MPSLRQKIKLDPPIGRVESDGEEYTPSLVDLNRAYTPAPDMMPLDTTSTVSHAELYANIGTLFEDVQVLKRSAMKSSQHQETIEQLRENLSVLRGEIGGMKLQVRQLAKHCVECARQLKRCVGCDQVDPTIVNDSGLTDSGPSRLFIDVDSDAQPKFGGQLRQHALTPSSNVEFHSESAATFQLGRRLDETHEAIDSAQIPPRSATPGSLTSQSPGNRRFQSPRGRFSVFSAHGKHATMSYRLHSSIWDAVLIIGAPNLGVGVSSALLLCLILNLLLLAMFIVVIGSVVTVPNFSESIIDEFTFWRATIAHDISLRNPITGESLASEVCNKKLSTPFSNVHLLNLIALDKYLAGFGNEHVCTGGVMCALALSVWFMTLIEEVRHILQIVIAGLGLPTTSDIGIEPAGDDVQLKGISACKKTMMLWLCGVRLGIVGVLAWYGVRLLVFEVSVESILLNAVSLGFILNVDDLIFTSLAPKVALALVDRMQPLPLPQFAPVQEFIVLPFLVGVPLVLVTIFELAPNVRVLSDSREALCGGARNGLDFVVAVDAIGIPWAASTPTSNNVISSFSAHAILEAKKHGFRQVSVQTNQRGNRGSFMHVSSSDALQTFQSIGSEFRQPKDWEMVSVTQFARVIGWDELDVLGPGGHDFGDQQGTVYNTYIRHLLKTPATANTTCANVPMSSCTAHGGTLAAVVMRQLCPSKCGCDEPAFGTVSGLYSAGLGFAVSGCARMNLRKQRFQNALAALPCTDTVAHDTFASWALGLGDTPLQGDNVSLQSRIVASFVRGKCSEAVKFDLGVGIKICEETSMAAICPESCGCNTSSPFSFYHSNVRYFCPHACTVGTTFCFTTVRHYTHNISGRSAYGPLVGYACIFPFVYQGQRYTNCTLNDWPVPWCAVTVRNGVVLHWGDCPSTDCDR